MNRIIFLLGIFSFLTNCGRKEVVSEPTKTYECCEKTTKADEKTIKFLYPICGDTSLYLKITRTNEFLKSEEVIKDGVRISGTYFRTFSDSTFSYDECLYDGNFIFECKEHFLEKYSARFKTYNINDSISLKITYFKNGNMESYGLAKHGCLFGRTVELDSLGQFYWVGNSDPTQKEDSLWLKRSPTDSTFEHIMVCGQKNGEWTKFDKNDKALQNIIYVDGKIKNYR